MLSRRYQISLLIAVVLTVFYPGIFGEFCSSDDLEMVSSLLNLNDWSLKGLFVPKAAGGLYYRPLLYLTFIFDRFGWFLSSSFMHLENILLHLANTLLVYFIALELLDDNRQKTSYLPLVAALCFGLHPITTETVNWISARPDAMAGTFVFMSALSLLKFKHDRKKRFLIISLVTFLMGMLSKEVALAFLPGAVLILLARKTSVTQHPSPDNNTPLRNKLITILVLVCMFIGSVLAFIWLRSLAFTTNSSKIAMTLRFIFIDLDHSLLTIMRTLGFYFKKIVYPFPLNFTIIDIDPLYEILAVPVLLVAVYVALKRSLVSAIFLSGMFLITPAFLIAFNQIAWTPYAERYIYIASAFITVAVIFWITPFVDKLNSKTFIKVGVVCILLIMTTATFRRNLVWQSNLELFKDTVEKSPGFNKAWNEYGIALYKSGDIEGARAKFIKAGSLYSFEYDDVSRLNLAFLDLHEGKEEEAVKGFLKVLDESKGKSSKAYEYLIAYYNNKLRTAINEKESHQIANKLLAYNDKLYALKGTPFILYNSGRLALNIGEKGRALEYFKNAYDRFPEGDEYKGYAKKFVVRLEKE
jgi:tetratricopeptide (TPR) repeat protein